MHVQHNYLDLEDLEELDENSTTWNERNLIVAKD